MRCNLVHFVVTFSLLGLWGVAAPAQPSVTEAAAKYNALIKEYDKAQQDFAKRLQDAATVAEQAKLFRDNNPQPAIATRFVELAKSYPKDPAAYASLIWVVQNSEFGPGAEKPYAQAIALLASQYADHKDSEQLFERMASSPFATSGQFLKAVYEKHPSPSVRGRAGFHLALYLKKYCETVNLIHVQPELAENIERFVGPDLFKQLKNADTAAMLRQADDVFARVQKDYPLTGYKRTVLGKAAEAELFELRYLMVGKTAPDLEGEDLDGKKFKLSDYRGKVVVIVFWGTWCGHCMAMVPHERSLVKRLEGQPFALLGVNSDPDREKLKPILEKKGITWRSFWDGGDTEGPIATRWNVQGWPMVYVLDARGVIRYKHVRDKTLDRVVDELMKEK